jgi:hypothetical protein
MNSPPWLNDCLALGRLVIEKERKRNEYRGLAATNIIESELTGKIQKIPVVYIDT